MSGLPTGASPPAACHVLIAPGSPHGVLTTSGVCAQPESVAAPKCCPFPSWAFAPPSRPGLSGLTMRATAWHPLMTLAREAVGDCSPVALQPGLQRLPPGELCQPLSRLACRLGVSGRRPVVLPPLDAWAWRTLQRSKPPGLSPDFPTRCSPPAARFPTLRWFRSPLGVLHTLGVLSSAGVRCAGEEQAPRRP
jgi:hypothetical protein